MSVSLGDQARAEWRRFLIFVLREVLQTMLLLVMLLCAFVVDQMIGLILPHGIEAVDLIHEGLKILAAFGIGILWLIGAAWTAIEYYRYRKAAH